MRRKRQRIHDAVLKSITAIAALIFIAAACCLDSEGTNVFWIACAVSGAWLALFCTANTNR